MSRFRVVTVGREFGCGSGEIARRLSERLGWKLFDRELIDEIARVAHVDPKTARRCDEHVDSWLHRIGKGLWAGGGDRGPAVVVADVVDADRMVELTRPLLADLAKTGQCVLVGRGANYMLRERTDIFHVFLYAPWAWRVQRLQRDGTSRAQAEATVNRVDQERSAYVRRYFGEEWPRRQLYDLMVNAMLGEEAVVEAVLAAMGARGA